MIPALILVEVLFFFVRVWAAARAVRRSEWAWEKADRRKVRWVVALTVSLFFPYVGYVVALYYLFWIDPQLDRHEKVGEPPGFPGGIPDY